MLKTKTNGKLQKLLILNITPIDQQLHLDLMVFQTSGTKYNLSH